MILFYGELCLYFEELLLSLNIFSKTNEQVTDLSLSFLFK